MINDKAKRTTYDKYGVENIRQAEEYVNIIRPDRSTELYRQFNKVMNDKVNQAMTWLSERSIEYVWSNWIDGHLYRLCIPEKDLLLDFEFYPVMNSQYNYIRINYNTNIIDVLERLFPKTVVNTEELDVWKITPKAMNKFLRENKTNPIYDKSILILALVKDSTIFQCMAIKRNKVIVNVTRNKCSVPYGTYILLRYFNEVFEIPEIQIKNNCDNSYKMSLYELLNLPVVSKTAKKKIWWSPESTKWHIDKSESENYIPFYFTEQITYSYPSNK